MTTSGVTQMLERRATLAGIDDINPHMFRHAAASYAMEHGLGDDAVMRLFGWRTRTMSNRYGAAVADGRVRHTGVWPPGIGYSCKAMASKNAAESRSIRYSWSRLV
jgi:integrase